ncbi:DUF6250 domain-containing protein [Streptomyces sp. NPDC007983]|uniref:DUF6250 domain-containing protein n=1 Tax=Streptomyces sp. NPDC007983 TaxID=3364800 RepID=UPI0036E0F7AB
MTYRPAPDRRRLLRGLTLAAAAAATSAAAPAALAAPATDATGRRRWTRIAHDDFRHGTRQWTAELESGGTVRALHGVLDVDVPGGATVWFTRELTGPYVIEYTATPVAAGGPNDHVTDLNAFWNARDVRSPGDLFATTRSGTFADYDLLKTYYVGYGANLNTTTRMRRYVGEPGNRPLLFDLTEPLLTPNAPCRVRLVSAGRTVQYWSNGALLCDYRDPEPYTSGWFGFRTVASHFRLADFSVWRPHR